MPITTFAAIDVGSNELAMKIFEVSKKNGIKELDHIRHTIELGSETYTRGKISHVLVNEMCEVLTYFSLKMKEYNVSDYIACATSGIREASNNVLILDQIKLRCNLKIKMLSNSEQRFLCYKALALSDNSFHKIIQKGTAIVDVGAGSIQISLFDKEALISTQNIKLGSLRIRELLSDMENQTTNFNALLSEYIDNDISTYRNLYLKENKIKHIIAVGDQLNELKHYFNINDFNESISSNKFNEHYHSLSQKTTDQISKELTISREQASLVLPTAMIFHKMFIETNAEFMWLSTITLCDGMAADYLQKKEKIAPTHNFTNDIILAAKNIADRYYCNMAHANNIESIALSLFDSIRKIHGLGKRERLYLQIAIILHHCGEYINLNKASENSYKIIMSTEIIGISRKERHLIANLVRYNTDNFPKFDQMDHGFDEDTYITLSKLIAIFRIANAMDKSHKQKFSKIRISLKDHILTITADTVKDITLEKGLFLKKANFFEEVYGISPILKQKRSMP